MKPPPKGCACGHRWPLRAPVPLNREEACTATWLWERRFSCHPRPCDWLSHEHVTQCEPTVSHPQILNSPGRGATAFTRLGPGGSSAGSPQGPVASGSHLEHSRASVHLGGGRRTRRCCWRTCILTVQAAGAFSCCSPRSASRCCRCFDFHFLTVFTKTDRPASSAPERRGSCSRPTPLQLCNGNTELTCGF